jgi:hypothetical protein
MLNAATNRRVLLTVSNSFLEKYWGELRTPAEIGVQIGGTCKIRSVLFFPLSTQKSTVVNLWNWLRLVTGAREVCFIGIASEVVTEERGHEHTGRQHPGDIFDTMINPYVTFPTYIIANAFDTPTAAAPHHDPFIDRLQRHFWVDARDGGPDSVLKQLKRLIAIVNRQTGKPTKVIVWLANSWDADSYFNQLWHNYSKVLRVLLITNHTYNNLLPPAPSTVHAASSSFASRRPSVASFVIDAVREQAGCGSLLDTLR